METEQNNFHNMLECFQYYPEIDLFACRLNAQFIRFFSYRPDPFAEVTNAFSVSWEDYCFPPFACIGKILWDVWYQEKVCRLKSIKQCGRPCHEFLVKRYTETVLTTY